VEDINVWFVTPAYQRFALADVCFDQRARMLSALPFEAHAVVVADDENLSSAAKYGLDTVERDNKYVGAKFNAGYQYAVKNGATHVMPVGSDSFLHPSVFEGANWGHRAIGIIGLSSFGPFGDERVDLGIKYPAGFGVGMVYPTKGMPHEPCSATAQYGCDNSTWNRCGRGKLSVDFTEHSYYTYCNFHSDDVQITDYASLSKGFNRIKHHEKDLDRVLAPLRGLYDGDLVDRLQALYAIRAVGAFLSNVRGVPRSTKPSRNEPRITQREMMKDRDRRIQEQKEARRARARDRIDVHIDQYQAAKRGESAVDLAGNPFDVTIKNFRVINRHRGA
jgi:hypothetical protein